MYRVVEKRFAVLEIAQSVRYDNVELAQCCQTLCLDAQIAQTDVWSDPQHIAMARWFTTGVERIAQCHFEPLAHTLRDWIDPDRAEFLTGGPAFCVGIEG